MAEDRGRVIVSTTLRSTLTLNDALESKGERGVRKRERWKKVASFREEFLELHCEYRRLLEELCERSGVKIAFWYSPSNVAQPQFTINKVVVNADELLDEDEFSFLKEFLGSRR